MKPADRPIRAPDGAYREPPIDPFGRPFLHRAGVFVVLVVFFAVCLRLSEVDPVALAEGLPRLLNWAARAWPPYIDDLDIMLYRAAETVAIATVATVVAFPPSVLISRNIAPSPMVAMPIRWVINALRGIDTVVFAILFVAAVGLGPFAGVMGMMLNAIGVITKLNSEAIETIPSAPLEAAAMSGANRAKIVSYAVLPSALPNLASTSLYVWEANVRTSTILGIEIKAAIDLLDFQKLFTLTVIVLAMVTIIDQLSAWLRRRLV